MNSRKEISKHQSLRAMHALQTGRKVPTAPKKDNRRVSLSLVFYLGNIVLTIIFFLAVTFQGCYFLPEYSSFFPSCDAMIYNEKYIYTYIFGLCPVPATELLKPLEYLKC